MELFETIIMLLLLLVISSGIQKKIPIISLPLVQIIIGIAIWFFLGDILYINSDLFLLLFVAPILYMDGEHIPSRQLWKVKTPIILLVLGLVFLTIFAVGSFVHWLIPSIPYAACFALGAILSPTDAIAVKAISGRTHIPHDILTIVEGESLLNDASGLVAFNFAIAAMLTGTFSIKSAALTFVYVAAGGIVFGVMVSILIIYLRNKLKWIGVDEAPAFTLIQILTPFLIFFLAEEIGFSGILAVVAAGITHALYANKKMSAKETNIKYVTDGAWATLLFTLNGLIFLILGLKLPVALKHEMQSHQISMMNLISYTLLIAAVLVTIRFIWSFVFISKKYGKRWYNAILVTFAGARGGITLAACLSIPLVLDDGSPFPQRDILLFVSGSVIIVTLLISNFILPVFAPKPADESEESIRAANRKVIQAAIDLLNSKMNEKNKFATYALISFYEELLEEESGQKRIAHPYHNESKIIALGFKAEMQEVKRLKRQGGYDREILNHIEESILFARARLRKAKIAHSLRRSILLMKHDYEMDAHEVARIRVMTMEAAIKEIIQHITPENEASSMRVINHYTSIIENFSKTLLKEEVIEYVEDIKKLELKTIHVQKDVVQEMVNNGEISHETAGILHRYIRLAALAAFSQELE